MKIPGQKLTLRLWKAEMICSATKNEEDTGKRWVGKGRQDQMVSWGHEKGFVFHFKCSVILLELRLLWLQVKEVQFKQLLSKKQEM